MPDFRPGILHIAEDQGFLLTGDDTGRKHPFGQPLLAEVAFLHDAFGARRKIRIDLRDKRPGITVVHASCAVGAGGHAKPATDAAVIVHHDDAVRSLERGLRGADPDAGRIRAVVAQNRQPQFLKVLSLIRMIFTGEDGGKRFRPDPFDLILGVAEIGNIVNRVTGGDAVRATVAAF